ncbi:hypothetical protein M9458_058146, partial [Cirrhinus mrigala]
VMSTMLVQECHLWVNLAQMAVVDKVCFLDVPVSQVGLFGDIVKNFAQQFLAVQKQTGTIKHILARRESNKPLGCGPPGPEFDTPDLRSLQLLSEGIELAMGELLGHQHPGTPASLRSDPETGDPEMGEIGRRLEPWLVLPNPSQFYSPYFIVPKKSGGLRPILDLQVLNQSLTRAVVRAQGPGASAPQSYGASGQLGEEQALPCAEHLFSRYGEEKGYQANSETETSEASYLG